MKLSFLITILCICNTFGQSIAISDVANLPTAVNETSGLIYFNDQLVTHNDSGNAPELYEISSTDGTVIRTVTITNATNVDWEDIAQDDTYIYIGDIGNNNGNRTNLKIYRILKSDFEANSSVTAEIINYSYANQTDFTSSPNSNDWDAEGFVIYDSQILLFTKNWVTSQVNVYAFPKTIGTHSASLVSNYNIGGLVTAADYVDHKIYLTGYSPATVTPFIAVIYDVNISVPNDMDLFGLSSIHKFENVLPFAHQVESICYIDSVGNDDRLYITNERFSIGAIVVEPSLKMVTLDNFTLGITDLEIDEFETYPNPFSNQITISDRVDEIHIYDSLGKQVLQMFQTNTVDTSSLSEGVYYIELITKAKRQVKKLVKQ
jgi:hypothetical protein